MLLSGTNRLHLRRLTRSRPLRIVLLIFLLVNALDVLRIRSNIANGESARTRRAPRPHERVYIAAMHWNNAAILKSHWNDAVLRLTETLGPENVFVSVYESGSWDDSKAALGDLDRELERRGVPRRVELSEVTHRDEIASEEKGEGWIDTSRGMRELRRIPYLARLRNKTLKDLLELSKQGTHFDKVLFLNDVVFTVRYNPYCRVSERGRKEISLMFTRPTTYLP